MPRMPKYLKEEWEFFLDILARIHLFFYYLLGLIIKCAIIKSVSNKIYYERLNRNEESKMPNTQS